MSHNLKYNNQSNIIPKNLSYPVKDIINQLNNNVFTKININKFTKHLELKNKPLINDRNKKINQQKTTALNKTNKDFFKPRQKDSLFWCFYILKHGLCKYETDVGNNHFIIEKKEKFKYIELMRSVENKALLKLYKIKSLIELEDDLANKPQISTKTFFALCIIEKINVLLVDKRKAYECMCSDIETVHIIHKNILPIEYYIELNNTPDNIKYYGENYYKMQHFEGKLKSLSAYKLSELLYISKKLEIDINTDIKLTKNYIYELIKSKF
jgi:hypothetical protein